MSISALALAALGLTANAQQACDLSDGLGLQPAAFQTETEACFEGLNGVTPDTFMQGQLGQFAAADRSDAGKASLTNLATLNEAARIHTGVAAVRANGRIYLVQLFSRVEGTLQAPMPTQVNGKTDLKAVFAESRAEPLGWSVVSTSGNVLAKGIGDSVPASELKGQSGYLTIDMALGKDRYTLKGPAVSLF